MTEKEFKIQVLPMSNLVYPMAKRLLRSEEAAQDAIQLSMLKLWENRHKLKKCESVKAFVFRVVRNTCLDELKKKKVIYFENYDQIKTFNTNFEPTNYEEKEAIELVQIFMNQLPKSQMEVLQMRDIDGLDFDEIAEILATDIPYVRVLLSRARKTLKMNLQKVYAYEALKKR